MGYLPEDQRLGDARLWLPPSGRQASSQSGACRKGRPVQLAVRIVTASESLEAPGIGNVLLFRAAVTVRIRGSPR